MDASLWVSAAIALVGALIAQLLMPSIRPVDSASVPDPATAVDGAESWSAEEEVDRAGSSAARPA
jgi:hypothetical protein